MPTLSFTPSDTVWSEVNAFSTVDKGCVVEIFEPGQVRVRADSSTPVAGAGEYHLLTYPEGKFVYSGNEKLWVRNHNPGTVRVVVTVIV